MNEPNISDALGMRAPDRRPRIVPVLMAASTLAVAAGCHVTVDPIRVEPIHLTLDITLKVDRELDRFFDFEDPGALPENDESPTETGGQGDQT